MGRGTSFQEPHLRKSETTPIQKSIFPTEGVEPIETSPKPQDLVPLPLNFWRWPQNPHNGPAIYLVMDKPKNLEFHILLYIGETVAAEKRWKGSHDCKAYLSSYSESMAKVGLKIQLNIRFWTDAPQDTYSRRRIEQLLIQKWLPPFNKETRGCWNTPFNADRY